MAEVKFSGIGVVDMNGSVGNTCFARNFYGVYAKMRIGAPVPTAYLLAWQMQYASLVSIWQLMLTDADRQEWYKVYRTALDSMAVRNKITGFQLFMSVNLNLFLAESSGVLVPPTSTELLQTTQPSITLLTSAHFFFLCSNLVNTPCLIFATVSLPAGRMTFNQIYTYIDFRYVYNGVIDISAEYISRLGAPVTNLKVFLKIIPISVNSARRGVPQYASSIVS